MKSPTSNKLHSRNRKILIICISLAILSCGIVFGLEKTRVTNLIKDPFYKETTIDTDKANINDPTLNNKNNTVTTPGVDSSKTTDQIPESTTTSISITKLTQSQKMVNADISINSSTTDGICSYTFTKDGAKPVTRSVNSSNNSCTTSIPELEFEMIGTWNLKAKYFSNNTQTTTNSEVTIN